MQAKIWLAKSYGIPRDEEFERDNFVYLEWVQQFEQEFAQEFMQRGISLKEVAVDYANDFEPWYNLTRCIWRDMEAYYDRLTKGDEDA